MHRVQLDQQGTLVLQELRCVVIRDWWLLTAVTRELLELKEDKDHKVSKVAVVIQDSLETQDHQELE